MLPQSVDPEPLGGLMNFLQQPAHLVSVKQGHAELHKHLGHRALAHAHAARQPEHDGWPAMLLRLLC